MSGIRQACRHLPQRFVRRVRQSCKACHESTDKYYFVQSLSNKYMIFLCYFIKKHICKVLLCVESAHMSGKANNCRYNNHMYVLQLSKTFTRENTLKLESCDIHI